MKKFVTILAAIAVGVFGFAVPAQATATMRFSLIQYDAPGADTTAAKSVNGEVVRFSNTSTQAVILTGWTLRDAQNHIYTFPAGRELRGGGTVYIHSGKGTNGFQPNGTPDSSRLYMGRAYHVWNNTGDTATLKSASGRTYDTCGWTRVGTGKTNC